MNLKNFLIGTAAGFIIYNVLGYVFYQLAFPDLYPKPSEPNMMLITLGCLFGAMVYSYIYSAIGGASSLKSAAMNGAIIGLLFAVSMNCFMYSSMPLNTTNMLTDIFISVVMACVTSIVIWFATSKFGNTKNG